MHLFLTSYGHNSESTDYTNRRVKVALAVSIYGKILVLTILRRGNNAFNAGGFTYSQRGCAKAPHDRGHHKEIYQPGAVRGHKNWWKVESQAEQLGTLPEQQNSTGNGQKINAGYHQRKFVIKGLSLDWNPLDNPSSSACYRVHIMPQIVHMRQGLGSTRMCMPMHTLPQYNDCCKSFRGAA